MPPPSSLGVEDVGAIRRFSLKGSLFAAIRRTSFKVTTARILPYGIAASYLSSVVLSLMPSRLPTQFHAIKLALSRIINQRDVSNCLRRPATLVHDVCKFGASIGVHLLGLG